MRRIFLNSSTEQTVEPTHAYTQTAPKTNRSQCGAKRQIATIVANFVYVGVFVELCIVRETGSIKTERKKKKEKKKEIKKDNLRLV